MGRKIHSRSEETKNVSSLRRMDWECEKRARNGRTNKSMCMTQPFGQKLFEILSKVTNQPNHRWTNERMEWKKKGASRSSIAAAVVWIYSRYAWAVQNGPNFRDVWRATAYAFVPIPKKRTSIFFSEWQIKGSFRFPLTCARRQFVWCLHAKNKLSEK